MVTDLVLYDEDSEDASISEEWEEREGGVVGEARWISSISFSCIMAACLATEAFSKLSSVGMFAGGLVAISASS